MSQCRGWEGRNPRYLSLWWQRLRLRDVARFSQGAALGFLPRSACLPLKPPSSHGGNQIGQNRTDTASHTVCMMSTSSEALAAFSWSPVTSVSLFLCFMLFHDCARRDCRPHQHDRKLICESYLLEYVIPPPPWYTIEALGEIFPTLQYNSGGRGVQRVHRALDEEQFRNNFFAFFFNFIMKYNHWCVWGHI